MRIEESFQLDAPRDDVFAFLSDGSRVAACVPGVENLTECGDGTYEANLKAQLGPIKAMFKGQVTLETKPPGRLEASGRGQDRASGSRAEVTFSGDLTEVDGGGATQVATVADVTIRGRLGQFGTGVIRATATELIREFVACANAELTAQASAAAGTAKELATTGTEDAAIPARREAPTRSPRRQTSQFRLLLRILVRLLHNGWDWLVQTVRRLVGGR